ncbi:MAG: hypothetical protein V3V41_02070 [Candidatus Heimdallarchaeota archaeon]
MAFTAEIDRYVHNTEDDTYEVRCVIKEDGVEKIGFQFLEKAENVRDRFLADSKACYLQLKNTEAVTPAPAEEIEKEIWTVDENTGDLS